MSLKRVCGIALALLLCLSLSSCAKKGADGDEPQSAANGRYLSLVDDDPDTLDPQCTSSFYTIPLNVFDRLTEIGVDGGGVSHVRPSLAKEWDISEDGLTYTFRLREGVRFSNGAALTASDVLYTFKRLLTYPDACNRDAVIAIKGAEALRRGESETLAGFRAISAYEFSITLEYPYAAFLACLATPGASILDEETTEEAGELFGKDASHTVGTGPFMLSEWYPGSEIILDANPDCWSGAPKCAGLDLQMISDPEAQRVMFEKGELDILDLDNMGTDAEFFARGDIYRDYLRSGPRVGITYIALNQSVEPLDRLPVRKALQLALDRQLLLNAAYSGRGQVENGIFPNGLAGADPALEAIPYAPEEARRLLSEAGYAQGFALEIALPSSSGQTVRELLTLTAAMWRRIGVDAQVKEMADDEFMALRKGGKLACYCATWSADFDDPDNFIYTFFGNEENTVSRSLCYPDAEVMARVRAARAIADEDERVAEYRALEKKIVQEDAAWIPLFSRLHLFVVGRRTEGFKVSWNGWSSNCYRDVAVLGR